MPIRLSSDFLDNSGSVEPSGLKMQALEYFTILNGELLAELAKVRTDRFG